jgi:hypothetical protein
VTSPTPKVLLPDAVDDHPRRQRIAAIDDPLCQTEPVSWQIWPPSPAEPPAFRP